MAVAHGRLIRGRYTESGGTDEKQVRNLGWRNLRLDGPAADTLGVPLCLAIRFHQIRYGPRALSVKVEGWIRSNG